MPAIKNTKTKVVICANSSWNLYNFRSNLIVSLVDSGYDVYALAPIDSYSDRLKIFGCTHVPIRMDAQSENVFYEIMTLIQIALKLCIIKPKWYLGFTVKPNIYGSIAAAVFGVKVINNIAGLGVVFNNRNNKSRFFEFLYKITLLRSYKVFFKNREDIKRFVTQKIIHPSVAVCLPGSGVDLIRFKFSPMSKSDLNSFRFLLVSRLIRSKGIREYVDAARMLRTKYPNCEFCILGFLGVKNPEAISESELNSWIDEGVISYLGASDSIQSDLVKAHCVVLPSYYAEGVPRSLLEAAAVGRPIITADNVGCKEVVMNGVNGFICRPRDSGDLALKMEMVLTLPFENLSLMGDQSRKLVENKFDEKIVLNIYQETMAN